MALTEALLLVTEAMSRLDDVTDPVLYKALEDFIDYANDAIGGQPLAKWGSTLGLGTGITEATLPATG